MKVSVLEIFAENPEMYKTYCENEPAKIGHKIEKKYSS